MVTLSMFVSVLVIRSQATDVITMIHTHYHKSNIDHPARKISSLGSHKSHGILSSICSRRSARRPKGVVYSTPLVMESIMLPTVAILVRRTRSRGHFWTSQLSQRSRSPIAWSWAAAGSGWPETLRSHSELLCTGHRLYHGTQEPEARPHRSNWLHGSPDESVMLARRGVARVAACCARTFHENTFFVNVNFVLINQTKL